MDTKDPFAPNLPAPTANRPLLGLTVLVIEDSHFACEAMRLLCLRAAHAFDGLTVCDPHADICKYIAHPLPS